MEECFQDGLLCFVEYGSFIIDRFTLNHTSCHLPVLACEGCINVMGVPMFLASATSSMMSCLLLERLRKSQSEDWARASSFFSTATWFSVRLSTPASDAASGYWTLAPHWMWMQY